MIITWIWLWLFSLGNETSNLSLWWALPPSFHLLTLPDVSTLDRLTEVQADIRYSSTVAKMFLLLSPNVAQEGTRARFSCWSWSEKTNPRNPDVPVSATFIINQNTFGLKVFHYSVVSKGVLNVDSWILSAEFLCYQASAVKCDYPSSIPSPIASSQWHQFAQQRSSELQWSAFLNFLVWSIHSLPQKGSWNLSFGATTSLPKPNQFFTFCCHCWCFCWYIPRDGSSLVVHNVSNHKREIWTQKVLLKVVVETASSGKENCFSSPLKCKDLKAFLLAEIGGWAVVSLQHTQMQLNSPRWNLKYSIAASWAASALTATGEGCKGSHLVIHQHFYTLSSAACLEGRCATFLKIQLDDSSQFSFILSVAEPSKAFF